MEPEVVARICRAVAAAIKASGMTQDQVAEGVGRSQQQVSLWATKREPKLDEIEQLEDVLDLHRGALLRSAGYVADIDTVEDALRTAAGLKRDRRNALVDLYRTWLHEA